MRMISRSLLLLAFLPVALPAQDGSAPDGQAPRQFYGPWQKHPKANYWFAAYNYKPAADAANYEHHYVIWTAASPKFCYCYNPNTKSYYGRWDVAACGKQGCHLGDNPHGYYAIAKAQQKGTLADIPETAFTARTSAPQIPADSGNPVQPAPAATPAAAAAAGAAANAAPAKPASPAATPATPAAPSSPAAPETPAENAPAESGAQANANPAIQPPPDLPDEAFPGPADGNS